MATNQDQLKGHLSIAAASPWGVALLLVNSLSFSPIWASSGR